MPSLSPGWDLQAPTSDVLKHPGSFNGGLEVARLLKVKPSTGTEGIETNGGSSIEKAQLMGQDAVSGASADVRAAALHHAPTTTAAREQGLPLMSANRPKGPADVGEVVGYADLLRSRGKTAEAMSLYDCALGADPRCAAALVGKGACLQQQQQPRPAFACFIGALALDPLNVQALTRCGQFYTEEGHLMEGIEVSPLTLDLRIEGLT